MEPPVFFLMRLKEILIFWIIDYPRTDYKIKFLTLLYMPQILTPFCVFDHADYGIVGNLHEVVEKLISTLL